MSLLKKCNNHFDVSVNMCHLLDLLVDNDANSVLGYIVHSSCFTMVALVRHSFLNGTCALKTNACNNVAMFPFK